MEEESNPTLPLLDEEGKATPPRSWYFPYFLSLSPSLSLFLFLSFCPSSFLGVGKEVRRGRWIK
jgi:hypothetical protein